MGKITDNKTTNNTRNKLNKAYTNNKSLLHI